MRKAKIIAISSLSLVLVLSAVLILRANESTASDPVLPVSSDNFGDNITNLLMWTASVTGTGPQIAETNQRLEITFPSYSADDPASGVFGAGYNSVCQLSGDFDIQVDYELLVWPYSNGVRVGLGTDRPVGPVERISFGSSADFPGYPREVYLTHFIDGVQGITSTNDFSGKLRLVRSGSTITGYYFSSGNWVPIHTGPTTTANVPFSLGAWSHDYAFMDQNVMIAFDNFIVSQGQLICPIPPVKGVPIVEEDFDGAEIDAVKWNTTIATTGKRWCSTTVENHHSNPGNWQDVSIEPCHDFTQAPPYGAITVGNGQASFSAGWIRTFPYIWAGPPSKPSPFPNTGDFIFEVRMKYDSIQGHGDGLSALLWENSDPVGNNPPASQAGVFSVFAIWADTAGLRTGTPGRRVFISDPFAFHDYRLEYIGGKYSLFVDGILKVGPFASDLRPNTIWIGNPVFTHWGITDWIDFTIDFIRVSIPYLEVPVDIKPQSCPNPLNVNAKGVLPVAILGTADFDVNQIDLASIKLEGVSPLRSALEDVATPFVPFIDKEEAIDCTTAGANGYLDLTLKFDNQGIAAALGAVSDGEVRVLKLTGSLRSEFGGTPIVGEDVAVILKKK